MAGLFTKKKKDEGNNKDVNPNNNNNNNGSQSKQRPAPPPNGLGLNNNGGMNQSGGFQPNNNNGGTSNYSDNNHPMNSSHPQGYPPAAPSSSQSGHGSNSNMGGPLSPISPTSQQQQQQPMNLNSLAPSTNQKPPGASTVGAGAALPPPQLFWTQRRILGSNPFPRFQHTSSVTSTGTDIFVFGGSQRGVPKSDLYVIDTVSLQCQAVTPAGADPPMPKSGHAAVNIGQYIIYFGGWDQTTGQCDDSLHVLHTARREWNKPTIQGPLPTPRHSHTGSSVGTTMYIFGGQVDNYYLGDILAFDMKTITQNPRWEVIEPQTESPPARSGHSAAVFEGKIYVFGGADADYFYNDIWCFDTRAITWTPIPASGYLPSGRHGHACTIVDGVLYIFGGNSPDGTELNDAYAFRINERRWYLFQNMGQAATPRYGHTMCTVKDKIYILGGESEQMLQEDAASIYFLEIPKIRFPETNPQPIPPRQVSTSKIAPNKQGNESSPQPQSQQQFQDNQSSDYDSDRNSGSGQQQQQPGRPDRPTRPERPVTQRPSSPATFATGGVDKQGPGNNTSVAQMMNPQLGQRPLTTMGAPPPRGASTQNNAAGGASQEYQGDGITMAARRQTLKEDVGNLYDHPRSASPVNGPGANRRTMHQPPSNINPNPSPLRGNNSGGPESSSVSNRQIPATASGEVSPIASRFDRRTMNNMSPAAPANNRLEDEINPYAMDVISQPPDAYAPLPPPPLSAPSSNNSIRQNNTPQPPASRPPPAAVQHLAQAPSSRSPSPATAAAIASARTNTRATPTPPPQVSTLDINNSSGGSDQIKKLEQRMREKDEELAAMRKRENWLVTEVLMARQMNGSGDQQQQQYSQSGNLNDKNGQSIMADLEHAIENQQLEGHKLMITKSLLKLKEELRNTKMSVATQAQAASLKIKEAERIRTGALQEAAYLKAKLSSMSNSQQDPDALARVEIERAADLEKRLTQALGEMELLESHFQKTQEGLQQEKLSRISAEERSNNSSVLAEQAQNAHDRALSELASLHSRATKAEAESRDYATQLAEIQAGFSGHQSQSTGLLQKIADLRHQVEEHQTALERTQMAFSVANDRASRAEEQYEDVSSKLEKMESQRSNLTSELSRYKGESERLQSKVEELEGRWQISKDEVITLRKLVEDGLGAFNPRGKTQQVSAERKHDSIAILNTVSKVSGLEQELNSLKALHKSSQAAASKSADELAEAMIEVSKLEQSSMKAKSECISLQKLLAEEREGNSELRNELSKTEQDLEEKVKELENNEVQLGLLKDVMREKGIIAEDVMMQAAIRGSGDYATTLESKVNQAQERARSLEIELEETREHFTQQLDSFEAQRQATVQHSEKTSLLLRKMKNDLSATISEKEAIERNLSNLQDVHAQCGQANNQSKQNDERVRMLQLQWDDERHELTTQTSELQSKLMEAEIHSAELSQKIISITERVEEVETLNEAISEQLESMEEDASKFKKKSLNQEMQLKSDVERLVNEVHQAQELVQAKQDELENAFALNEQLESQLDHALQAQAAAATSGSDSKAMAAMTQQRQELEQRLKKAQENIQILEGDNSVLEARLQDSEKKVALLLEDMQNSFTDPSNPNSPLSSANLAGIHQQLNQHMNHSLSQTNAALNSAIASSSPNRSSPASNTAHLNSSSGNNSRNGVRAGSRASNNNRQADASPNLQTQKKASPNPNHYVNDEDPYHYGGSPSHNQYSNGHQLHYDGEDVNSQSYRDSVDSITRELEMLKVPWNKVSGDVPANQGGRKSSSPHQQQQQYQQNQNNYYGNGNGNDNHYGYNVEDEEDDGLSYLSHLQQRPSQQQQQQNYSANQSGTKDTQSFNDRSPSRLKEYEQMIDEIENSRRRQ
ncbi:Negative regulator of mitotic exit [Entomortierella beljakovae]|nr:Negative regulator of mitotic exit [Entomortierella beljakovae]